MTPRTDAEAAARRAADQWFSGELGPDVTLEVIIDDALAQAVRGERERLTQIAVEEYNDALRNGLDHIAAFRCMLAALRAPSPPEPHKHRAVCWRNLDGLGLRLVCLSPEVTR
jgi:hypothetical protein